MSEDRFVQLLLEVADGAVDDERDIDLARAAGRWAIGGGRWRAYSREVNGLYVPGEAMDRWVLVTGMEPRLEIRVRLEGGPWSTYATWPVAHVGHGLDLLAAERLIPARYCTIGRRAVEDHAEVLTRAGAVLRDLVRDGFYSGRGQDMETIMQGRVRGLDEAADSARRFAGGHLAVLT